MNPRSKSKSWPARLLRRARCLAARPSTPSRAGRWESRQGVTPFYRHLQQYSIKPELDGHEDHLKHMQSADGAVSCGGRSHYTVAVHTTPKNLRYEVMDELRVYAGAFEDDLKTAVREKINDGEKDWLPSYWDMFKSSPAWTCYRADLRGVPAAIFMAYDQGRGEAFLNALRTDPAIRRGGIATSLIRGMDKDLASKGFTYLRMATTSANEPMKNLCQAKFGLEFVPFRWCQTSERPMNAQVMTHAVKLDPAMMPAGTAEREKTLRALWALVQSSDYYAATKGMMMDVPGQFKSLNEAELEVRLDKGQCYVVGEEAGPSSSDSAPQALAIIGPDWEGPNLCLCFVGGSSQSAVRLLMGELRTLLPTEQPDEAKKVEVSGYLPLGSHSYEMAASKVDTWFCPRETLELVMGWKAGSLNPA